jgi:type I restriction enzyme, S subunit
MGLHVQVESQSIANEWPTLSLREAGISLIDCEHRTPPASDTGFPYIAIPQIKHGRLDLTEVRRVSREHFLEWTRKAHPQPYDVILSRRCNPGENAFVPPGLECALGQNLVLLRADGAKVIPAFLRWLVRSDEWWGQIGRFLNVGAIFNSLKCADIPNFRLVIPPISEQHALVNVLGTLDDKIELNRRMNKTLEAMARAIFKSWFVDFDPVRAKAESRQPFGMDAAAVALFPDSFQDSPLGKIPKGWSVSHFPNEIDYLEGPGLRNWQYRTGGVRFLNIRCIEEGDLIIEKANCISEAEFWEKYSHFALEKEDIVISTSGTLGRIAIVREDHLPVMLNTSIIRMRGRRPVGLSYVWATLQSDYFLDEMFALASGSVQLNFGPMHLRRMKLLRPPDSVLKQFENVAGALLRSALVKRQESKTLAAIRDALLPKLISGEIRVKDAVELLEKSL